MFSRNGKCRETGCGRDKERGVREREREGIFSHPVQWISNTALCPRGQFMHWNPELLLSMRHLVSSMRITPQPWMGNHFGSRATNRGLWETGWWGLECEELQFSLCVFVSISSLWTDLVCGCWVRIICDVCSRVVVFLWHLQPASHGSISVGNFLVFQVQCWLCVFSRLWTCCWLCVGWEDANVADSIKYISKSEIRIFHVSY